MSPSFALTNLPSELTAKISAYALTPSKTAQCFFREATDTKTREIQEAFANGHTFHADELRMKRINEELAQRWYFSYRHGKTRRRKKGTAREIGVRPPPGYIHRDTQVLRWVDDDWVDSEWIGDE